MAAYVMGDNTGQEYSLQNFLYWLLQRKEE